MVDTYQCEWKTAVESEQSRKRFRRFVNSDKSDLNIVFVEERDQIRPATEEEKLQLQGANNADQLATEVV